MTTRRHTHNYMRLGILPSPRESRSPLGTLRPSRTCQYSTCNPYHTSCTPIDKAETPDQSHLAPCSEQEPQDTNLPRHLYFVSDRIAGVAAALYPRTRPRPRSYTGSSRSWLDRRDLRRRMDSSGSRVDGPESLRCLIAGRLLGLRWGGCIRRRGICRRRIDFRMREG